MVVDIGEVKRYIKPKADSTLHNMRKADLIEYIRCLEHNYNVAVSFNENQAKYVESLGLPIGFNSVSERLPDKMGQYVCRYVFGENVDCPFFQVLWYFANLENPHFQHEGSMGLRVTHWMPLPEPPQEEKQ